MICQLTVIGNIVREPEFSGTDNGRVQMKTAVAYNWGPREQNNTAFFEITYFMSQEMYQKLYYIYAESKGKRVVVIGNLKPKKEKDGRNYAWLNVYANELYMLSPKEEVPQQAQPVIQQPVQQPVQQPIQQPVQPPVAVSQVQAPPIPASFPGQVRANTGNPLPPPPMVG